MRHLRTRLKTIPAPEGKAAPARAPHPSVSPYRPLVAMLGNNCLLTALPPPTSKGPLQSSSVNRENTAATSSDADNFWTQGQHTPHT